MMDWPDSIRSYRQRHGLKQQALAELLHCDQTAISHWERGLSKPSLASQRKLIRMIAEDERGREDIRLIESVERSPGLSALFDTKLRVLAGSARFWRIYEDLDAHNPDTFLAFGNEENHGLIRAAFSDIDAALVFEGEINVRPNGSAENTRMSAVASPVKLSDDSYALRIELGTAATQSGGAGTLNRHPFKD